MRYNDIEVTLTNYKSIFEGYLPEVQDEIRSAIMDNTPIGMYIDECSKDAYKLGQIRCAMREFIDPEYIDVIMSGTTIFYIRMGMFAKVDMSGILQYIGVLSENHLEKVAQLCYIGIDISKMDFTRINDKIFDIVCKGLIQKYPMWLLQDIKVNDEGYVKLLMQGLRLGFDIHPFLEEEWSAELLVRLFTLDKDVYTKVLQYINNKTDVDVLMGVIECVKAGVDITPIMGKYSDGYDLYDSYQLTTLLTSASQGLDISKALNFRLTDSEMLRIIKEENNIV